MDISRLNISIPSYQTTFEEGTVTYTVLVEYGGLSWEVWRRYSQFTQLYQDLEDDGYCALPRLPPKTLIGPPQDPEALAERRQRLQLFLRNLLKRPDTRTSPQLLDFILFNEQTNLDIEPLRPACVCSTGIQRFAASALAYSATRKLLIIGHEDRTGLSRLGRLWSIVEPDEFGMLNFWRVEGDFNCLSLLYSFKTQAKVRCVHLDDLTGQVFVGHDDGNIAVYCFPTESSGVEKVAVLPLHHAAVMRLSAGNTNEDTRRRLLSIGYDGAMRIFEIASHRVICGGRLSQRLLLPQGGSSILTAALLYNEKDVAILGTSAGHLLTYRVKNNPPEYMQSCVLQPSRSVEALLIDKALLYVAHGDCISILSIEWRREDIKLFKVGALNLSLGGVGSAALSMAFNSHPQHLFVGADPAIAWWSLKSGEPLCVFDGHRGGAHQLLLVDGGQVLISSGDSGNTKVWRLPPADEMHLWEGRDASVSSSSSSSSPSATTSTTTTLRDDHLQEASSHNGSSRSCYAAPVSGAGDNNGRNVRRHSAEEENTDDASITGGRAAGSGFSEGEKTSLLPPVVRSSLSSSTSSLLTQLPPAAATAARAARAAAATAAAAAEYCIQAGAEYLPVATHLPSSLCNRMSGRSNSGPYDGSSSISTHSDGYESGGGTSSASYNDSRYSYENSSSSGDARLYYNNIRDTSGMKQMHASCIENSINNSNSFSGGGLQHHTGEQVSSAGEERHALLNKQIQENEEKKAVSGSGYKSAANSAADGFLRPLVGAGSADDNEEDDDTLNDLRSAFR